jgi:hypothetical protein
MRGTCDKANKGYRCGSLPPVSSKRSTRSRYVEIVEPVIMFCISITLMGSLMAIKRYTQVVAEPRLQSCVVKLKLCS